MRGVAIYFSMLELPKINWMYNHSLAQFKSIFIDSIEESPKNPNNLRIEARVEVIIKALTLNYLKVLSRCTFERDKTCAVLMLCLSILLSHRVISSGDVQLLLHKGDHLPVRNAPPFPEPERLTSWLTVPLWNRIFQLSKHHFCKAEFVHLQDLPSFILSNKAEWAQFAQAADPELRFPKDLEALLAPEKPELATFIRLVVINCLREDRFIIAARQLFRVLLGREDFPAPPSYDSLFDMSEPLTPVMFLLTAGADPSQALLRFAQKDKKKIPIESISLGEGQ